MSCVVTMFPSQTATLGPPCPPGCSRRGPPVAAVIPAPFPRVADLPRHDRLRHRSQPVTARDPLILGSVLRLRQVAAGHALTLTLVLFSFIRVLAIAGVVYAERGEPESTLRDWPTAASQAIPHRTHLRGDSPDNPLSEDGIALSFALANCGLIVAALLTAQIASWVVGSQRTGDPGVAPTSEDSRTHRART